MLQVVVHVPVDESTEGIHVDRSAIQPVVEDILGKTGMLGSIVNDHQPCPEKMWNDEEENREPSVPCQSDGNDPQIQGKDDPGVTKDFGKLALGNKGALVRGDVSEGVMDHTREIAVIIAKIEETSKMGRQIRRTWNLDLRIPTHDDGIAMVAGVAPAPDNGFTHHHEGSNLVKSIVHPVGLESGPVSCLVPA